MPGKSAELTITVQGPTALTQVEAQHGEEERVLADEGAVAASRETELALGAAEDDERGPDQHTRVT